MIDVTIERLGPARWHGRVEFSGESMSGEDDDCIGAEGEGATPPEAVENATAKLIALVRKQPELAVTLAPFVSPQLALVLVAARYLDAPDILKSVAKGSRDAVKAVARKLAPIAKRAKRVGRAFGALGKGLARALW